jgi:hypothetical protein
LVARQISVTHFGCGLQLYSSEWDPIGWDGSRDQYALQLYSKYVTEICLATKFIQIFYIRQKIWFAIKQSYWNCQFQINMLSIFSPYKSSLARGACHVNASTLFSTSHSSSSFGDQVPTPSLPDRRGTRCLESQVMRSSAYLWSRILYVNLNIQPTFAANRTYTPHTQGLTTGWLDIRIVRMPSQMHIW